MQTLVMPLRVVFQTVVIYVFLIAALSTVGRRQMLQISLLDYLIIALLGSAVETGLYLGGGSFWAGLVSASTLIAMNYLLSRIQDRYAPIARLIRRRPVLLVHDGHPMDGDLRRLHLTKDDLLAAIRLRGFDRLEEVRFAVMEADGEISVIARGGRKAGQR